VRSEDPVSFGTVLGCELEHIKRRRSQGEAAAPPEATSVDDATARTTAQGMDLVGLALSGGGIRSATFNLGVLQSMAEFGLIKRLDYISTVSGGGFIGSWLSTWIKREGDVKNVEVQLRPSRIDQAWAERKGEKEVIAPGVPQDAEPEPIFHLRRYSSYLSPRTGIFSVDTWALGAIYLRNSLLNQLILLLALAAVLLSLCFVVLLVKWLPEMEDQFGSGWPQWLANRLGNDYWDWVFCITMVVSLVWAFFWITVSLNRIGLVRKQGKSDKPQLAEGARRLWRHILIPLIIFAFIASWEFSFWSSDLLDPLKWKWFQWLLAQLRIDAAHVFPELAPNSSGKVFQSALIWGCLFGILLCLVRSAAGIWLWNSVTRPLLAKTIERGWLRLLWAPLAAFLPGFCGGVLLFLSILLVNEQILPQDKFAPANNDSWLIDPGYNAADAQPESEYTAGAAAVATFGTPLVLFIFVIGTIIQVGLDGKSLGEDMREWWASLCARVLLCAAIWMSAFAVPIFGGWLLVWLAEQGWYGKLFNGVLGSTWVVTTVTGLLAGRSPRTGSAIRSGPIDRLARLAPPVFLIGLLALLFLGLLSFVRLCQAASDSTPFAFNTTTYWLTIQQMPPRLILAGILSCLLLAGAIALRVDVNVFSLQGAYANRLVRCYLGASRMKRDSAYRLRGVPTNSEPPPREPNPITGFDPNDNPFLSDLAIGVTPWSKTPTNCRVYWGPYPILNTALNLVRGQELAWRERKAESFILTPRFCGSRSTNYRPSALTDGSPGFADNLRLGTAVAISGAAVSPNMGYHSSPAVGAFLTVFNVRTGAWLGNPSTDRWRDSGPRWALFHLLRELTGHTDSRSDYVYLSDGGHFDNLGIYELVNRRCRYIFACDASCDPNFEFADLGSAIRKCRTDFGIRIELDVSHLRPQTGAGWHCAVGTIRYDDIDPEAIPGTILYLKPSLTGDEPSDLQNYAVEHRGFPHQSTADQFFTESQFESYRSLGLHIAQEVLGPAMPNVADDGAMNDATHRQVARQLFGELERRWFPRPSELEKSFLKTTKDFIAAHKDLRTDTNLHAFSRSMYEDLGPPIRPAVVPTNGTDGPEPQAVPKLAERDAAAGSTQANASLAAEQCAGRHAVSQLLQIMENAWITLELDRFHAHPLNRGWMSVFRCWVNAPLFRRYWPALRGEYSRGFVRFAEEQLRLEGPVVEVLPLGQVDGEYRARAVRVLGREFCLEWPADQRRFEKRLEEAVPAPDSAKFSHLVWLISLVPPVFGDEELQRDVSASRIPCGLFLVEQPDAKTNHFDFFMWLRGPYRNLGIGRRALADLNQQDIPYSVESVWRLLQQKCAPRPFDLNVRYPGPRSVGQGARMQRAMWLRFFYDYGFRRLTARPGTQDEFVLRRSH
jgi:hypothetical protein